MTEYRLRRLVAQWSERLGLDRWRIDIRIGGGDESNYAEIERNVYERAVITFAPWLVGIGDRPDDVMQIEITDQFIETTVVHELLHLWTRNLRAVIRDDCDGLVHPDAFRQLDKAAERAEEQLVDGLATTLVRSWPKRSEPQDRRSRQESAPGDRRG